MPVDRALIRQLRQMDEYDLRRVLIFIRGLLLQRGDKSEVDESRKTSGKVSYRQEEVTCGKPGCTRCPHGPYWYAYWREGGRTRSRYIGKTLKAGMKP